MTSFVREMDEDKRFVDVIMYASHPLEQVTIPDVSRGGRRHAYRGQRGVCGDHHEAGQGWQGVQREVLVRRDSAYVAELRDAFGWD
jgi:hypothetical protein